MVLNQGPNAYLLGVKCVGTFDVAMTVEGAGLSSRRDCPTPGPTEPRGETQGEGTGWVICVSRVPGNE